MNPKGSPLSFQKNHPLAPYTTLRIGGPAEFFLHTHSSQELVQALKYALKNKLSPTILGNGSNVLISDSGLSGLVIKNSSTNIKLLSKKSVSPSSSLKTIPTYRSEPEAKKYLDFSSLDYDESKLPQTTIKVDSGTSLQHLIAWTFNQSLTGLQWFAGIPGTVGAAVYCNIHGGSYHFSDYLKEIEVFNLKTKKTQTLKKEELNFDYDQSLLQKKPELIILSATLCLFQGDVPKAQAIYATWTSQKNKVQPQNSAGCTFKNVLSPQKAKSLNFDSPSTSWVIDHVLKLKGKKEGGAQISHQHANFIVNTGNATAKDYLKLAALVQKKFKAKTGLDLEIEVKVLKNT